MGNIILSGPQWKIINHPEFCIEVIWDYFYRAYEDSFGRDDSIPELIQIFENPETADLSRQMASILYYGDTRILEEPDLFFQVKTLQEKVEEISEKLAADLMTYLRVNHFFFLNNGTKEAHHFPYKEVW